MMPEEMGNLSHEQTDLHQPESKQFKQLLAASWQPRSLFFVAGFLILAGILFLRTNRIPSNDVQAISVARDGTVWIATEHDGVSSYDGRSWTTYDEKDGLVTTGVSQKRYIDVAPDGTVWYSGGLGIYRFDGQRWKHYTRSDGLIDDAVQTLSVGPGGEVWLGTHSGVTRIFGTNIDNFNQRHGIVGIPIVSISILPNGDVWFASYHQGASHYDAETWTNYTTANSGLVNNDIRAIAANADGEIWFSTTGSGAFLFDGQNWTSYGIEDGMVSDSAWGGIAFGQDGSVWVGGKDGASQFKDGKWIAWNEDDGLAGDYLQGGIVAAPDGSMWFGSNNGVSRFDGRKWKIFSKYDGYAVGIGLIFLAVFLAGTGLFYLQKKSGSSPLNSTKLQDNLTRTKHLHPNNSGKHTRARARRDEMEIQTARKWYRWLWLSPFLTIPTLVIAYLFFQPIGQQIICPQGWSNCNYEAVERLTGLIAVCVSSLWHLVLLIPATNKQYPFVMWHGRQALLLALLRTSVPIFFVLFAGDSIIVLLYLLLLIPIWLVGNLWGQNQAGRGDCSLMRWTGRSDSLPGPPTKTDIDRQPEISADALETTFRFSNDPQERQAALEELKKRGLVEYL